VPLNDLIRQQNLDRGDSDKVITEEELHILLNFLGGARVKVFIAVLFESGSRKGELKSLKIRDISFGES
jgi:integrase